MAAPLPFSLRQLQYAVAVADAGGFRRAAEACHVSQPALSAQLAALEEALGARLFERDRRRVLPTRAGEEVVARARALLAEAGDLSRAAQRHADPLASTLRLGVLPTISPYVLPEAVALLRGRFPRLLVLWTEDRTAAVAAGVRAGRLDAALLAIVPGLDDLACEPLAEDPFVLAGPAGHALLAPREPAAVSELRGEPVLVLDEGHCFGEQAQALCATGRARDAGFRATSLSTLAQMAAGGAGVTLLPSTSLAVENRRGELVTRRFAEPAPSRTIALAWRRSSPLVPALREVAGVLRAALWHGGARAPTPRAGRGAALQGAARPRARGIRPPRAPSRS